MPQAQSQYFFELDELASRCIIAWRKSIFRPAKFMNALLKGLGGSLKLLLYNNGPETQLALRHASRTPHTLRSHETPYHVHRVLLECSTAN